jgi:glycosyltransferase involved in cell wall biosynthesis
LRVRVLHGLGTMNPGGVETWLMHVLRNIDRERFQLDICTFGNQPGLYAQEVEELGGRMLRCPKGANLWAFRRRFRKILRDGNYNIVHSHVHLFSGALLCWAKAEGVPVRIAHSHTSRDDRPNTPLRACYRRLMKSWINRYATHGLAASRLSAAQLFGEDWESDRRFRILHYGIDLAPFQEPVSREQVRAELGIPIEAPVVGHVGRFVPAKNHRWLLEIAEAILKRRPDVHFLLVGDGPLRQEIEATARTKEFTERMHFVGTRTDVSRLMRGGMDVFVLPSLWEGLPVALIEAQAAGLHCVLSDTITNEVKVLTELLIRLPLSTPCDEWAEATLGALAGKVYGNGLAVKQLARTDFDIRRSASDLSDLYSRPEE